VGGRLYMYSVLRDQPRLRVAFQSVSITPDPALPEGTVIFDCEMVTNGCSKKCSFNVAVL